MRLTAKNQNAALHALLTMTTGHAYAYIDPEAKPETWIITDALPPPGRQYYETYKTQAGIYDTAGMNHGYNPITPPQPEKPIEKRNRIFPIKKRRKTQKG